MKRLQLRKPLALGAVIPLLALGNVGLAMPGAGAVAMAGSGKTVVLGTSLSLTGALGQFGIDLEAGYKEKVAEINAAGGLSFGGAKHKVSLTVLDNRSDPNTATQQIRELVLQDSAVGLLGACTPPIIVPEALAADQEKVPFVASCNPVHAFEGGNPSGWTYAWDVFISENEQAASSSRALLLASSDKKVALFTDTEPDGVAERPLYKQAFAAAGLKVVGDYTFPVGTTDFSSFINDAKAKGAQLVVAQMIPPDGIALWKQMKALSFKPVETWATKAPETAAWPQALGPVAEGTLDDAFWSPANGNPGSAALVHSALGKQFADSFVDLNIAVLAYTVAGVVTDAITHAGTTSGSAVNSAISKTNARYALGLVRFNSKHTATTPDLLDQWQKGKMVPILPRQSGVTLEAPMKGLN